jgi:DDE superfamily endonuclease
MDPARFVFLDETGTATNLTRRYGRSPSGRRLVAAVPHGHWQTTTFVSGLRESGIVAPLVLDGPMTGPAFCAYVEQFLAPTLEPGDVVVLDNLAAQRSTASARRSPRPGPRSSTCRPTRPTSTRSSSSLPSSRRSCARPRCEPRTSSGRPSAASSPPSRQPNVHAISTTATTVLTKVKMLSNVSMRQALPAVA